MENKELPDWMDRVSKQNDCVERKPAPPFEIWKLLSIVQCRHWYAGKVLPKRDVVARRLAKKYWMTAR